MFSIDPENVHVFFNMAKTYFTTNRTYKISFIKYFNGSDVVWNDGEVKV